jgi:hypothetical protein
MPTNALNLLRQARHKNEFQIQRPGHVLHTGFACHRANNHTFSPNQAREHLNASLENR